jgi:hypothetical protein
LTEDGYEVTGCKWFKNGIEVIETNTVNEFSYAEGFNKLLEFAPTYYMFRLITENYGEIPSTEKIISHPEKSFGCSETENSDLLFVYPNPVLQGNVLYIEGVEAGSMVYVYNHLGACVYNVIATHNSMKLSVDFPKGIYLIRTENKIVKIMIVK